MVTSPFPLMHWNYEREKNNCSKFFLLSSICEKDTCFIYVCVEGGDSNCGAWSSLLDTLRSFSGVSKLLTRGYIRLCITFTLFHYLFFITYGFSHHNFDKKSCNYNFFQPKPTAVIHTRYVFGNKL